MSDSIQSSLYREASRRGHDWRVQNRENDGGSTSHCGGIDPQASCSRRLREQGRIAWKNIACNPRFRRMSQTLCAVAALLTFSVLFLWAHDTSGITFARIAAACERVENVHVTRLCPRTGEIIQELWISTEMNFLAMTRAQEHVFYDLSTRQKARMDLTSGQMESSAMSDQEYTGVQRIAAMYPGPMLTDAPSDARWLRVPDEGDREVYQFTRTNRASDGQSYLVRFEVAIDTDTKLPQALRLFHNSPATAGWECVSQSTFEYPAGMQMMSLVGRACGQRSFRKASGDTPKTFLKAREK
ncbi:MAG: hypothetical protein ABFE13_19555 [Phycisphaerales bacterium]